MSHSTFMHVYLTLEAASHLCFRPHILVKPVARNLAAQFDSAIISDPHIRKITVFYEAENC